jgi:hypothetical protein
MMAHLNNLKTQRSAIKHHGILRLEEKRKLAQLEDDIKSTNERLFKHDVLFTYDKGDIR